MRQCISKQQQTILLNEFEINCMPTKERIGELSVISNLNDVTIMTWFRNRRYNYVKLVKQQKERKNSI